MKELTDEFKATMDNALKSLRATNIFLLKTLSNIDRAKKPKLKLVK